MKQETKSTPVVRVSRGDFDPARLAEVDRMARDTGRYLVPAIRALPGLIHYFAAVSPTGSMVHISIWESDAHAQQMGQLKEMIIDAWQAAEAAGVRFVPIVNFPITWSV
jgi:quinol monooxygenase YgiN